MFTLWIVHRDPQHRAALARLARAPEDTVAGGPGDPLFDRCPAADVVLLGLAGDFEAELQFAHRVATRHKDTRWILVADRSDTATVRELFDSIDAEILSDPPDSRVLRGHIRAAPQRTSVDRLPLSQRPARDLLAQRFARWFADLELPELLRALDPHLSDVPLLILGEPGSGRGMIARYVHAFGAASAGPFVHLACAAWMSSRHLRTALEAGPHTSVRSRGHTVWLENVNSLPSEAQRLLMRWIEFAPPPGALRGFIARWIATADDEDGQRPMKANEVRHEDAQWPMKANEVRHQGASFPDPALDPALREALCGISLRIPAVRERPDLIARFAADTALAWCSARGQQPRRFGSDAIEVLEQYPWPGNLRELEAVVVQTLAAGAADPIRADDLQYDATAFAPLDAGDIGLLIEPEPSPVPEALTSRREVVFEPEPSRSQPASVGGAGLERLAAALSHEMRNPLSSIRTFVELLPGRYDDAEFRSQFADLVGRDTRRLEAIVERLVELASLPRMDPTPVDMAAMLEELLDEHRELVRERRLLVLKELNHGGPHAIGDAGHLRVALEALVRKSFELVPERGDIFIAAQHHADVLRGGPAVRILVRFGARNGSAREKRLPGLSTAENSLEFALVEMIVHAEGGSFAIDTSESNETIIVLDIPAQ